MTAPRSLLFVGLSPALGRVVTLPRLEAGAVNRATSYLEVAAGKATNAARVARELGRTVVLVSPLGRDDAAHFSRLAAEDGIELDATLYPGRIRWALTLIDTANKNSTEIVIPEETPVPPEVASDLLQHLTRRINGAAACLVAGSRLPDIPDSILPETGRLCATAGVPLFLDLRGRDLIGIMKVYRSNERYRTPASLVVKINEEELRDTVQAADMQAASSRFTNSHRLTLDDVRAFAVKFRCTLVVTRGTDPVLFADPSGCEGHVEVPVVDARNPIGSGDTVLAVLASRMTEGVPLQDAVQEAVHAASRNAELLKPGTILGP